TRLPHPGPRSGTRTVLEEAPAASFSSVKRNDSTHPSQPVRACVVTRGINRGNYTPARGLIKAQI
uniref:Uncharacterized protein n=1 Tax=Aegilops tauschii subsp. strangulata TaxID=200361 RepID=A0A453G6T3_AEGTS